MYIDEPIKLAAAINCAVVKEYKSTRAKFAAKDIKINHSTRLKYIDKKKLLKGIYNITTATPPKNLAAAPCPNLVSNE